MTEEIIPTNGTSAEDVVYAKKVKEIYIDGVDVAGCSEFLEPDGCDSTDCASFQCDRNPNCYYKQLKRLEQENKKLRKANEISIEKVTVTAEAKRLQELEKENKELKEELKSYKHPDVVTLLTNWRTGELDRIHNKIANERDIYRSALEEIRENLVKLNTNDEDDFTYEFSKIEDKINEVLK